MPLNQEQITQLRDSINGYAFPAVYYDFIRDEEIVAMAMPHVEMVIANLLRSNDTIQAKHGLANVIYWGYAQIPFRNNRVNTFLSKITDKEFSPFKSLVRDNNTPTLVELRNVHMPEFSGVSFVSKILMFLDPANYCVLDQQLAQLRTHDSPKALNNLTFRQNDTQIRITNQNQHVYNAWCYECRVINQTYFQGEYRLVDVERGFFNLVQNGRLADAQASYNAA